MENTNLPDLSSGMALVILISGDADDVHHHFYYKRNKLLGSRLGIGTWERRLAGDDGAYES